MDVTILNTDLDAVSIVDTYESFIWTDRYYAYGDFELYEAMRLYQTGLLFAEQGI